MCYRLKHCYVTTQYGCRPVSRIVEPFRLHDLNVEIADAVDTAVQLIAALHGTAAGQWRS